MWVVKEAMPKTTGKTKRCEKQPLIKTTANDIEND